MEYFKILKINTTEEEIQEYLTLDNLEEMSTNIFNLDSPLEEQVSIGGIWGEFTLSRNKIKGGLRFALIECPNALCWTITTGYPPDKDAIIIHLTINRQTKNQEFIEEVTDFLEDHVSCLNQMFLHLQTSQG